MAIYDAVRTHFIPLCTLAGLGRTLFQMDQQQGYRRRGNTGDTAGLTQGVWSGLAEFGFDFIGEAGDAVDREHDVARHEPRDLRHRARVHLLDERSKIKFFRVYFCQMFN